MDSSVGFCPLIDADLPRLVEWFNRPHVYEWWGADAASDGLGGPGVKAATLTQVEAQYGARRTVDHDVMHYLIVLDERPIGMMQWYPTDVDPAYADAIDERGAVAIDYLIAETDLVGRGLGPIAIRRFVDDVVIPGSGRCRVVASPSIHNARSLRALEKAGFRFSRDAEVGEPTPERVMVFDAAQ